MTDPTPAPPSSPSSTPRRRGGPRWAIGGLVVALAGAAFMVTQGRSGSKSEHEHEHEAKAPRPAKAQAPMPVLLATDRAARAAATGDSEKARTALAEALKLAPDHAPALLVQACLALEAGNDAEAGAALEKLEDAAPGSKEAQLLHRLRELRRAPGTSWQQAFREAWVSLGRPDFEKSTLLPGATPLPPDPTVAEAEKATWTRATSDEVKLLLALGARRLDSEQALFLLSQVPKLEDPALYLAVMDALRGNALPESAYDEARKVFHQQLVKLAAAHPRSMQLQLLLLLGDTEQGSPMSAAEVNTLEKVSALPVWRENSYAELYQRAHQLLRDAGVPDASATAAAAVARSVVDRGSWVLRTRNVGTRGELSPEGVKRLGRISRDIGARMVEQPTLMERMAGLQLVRGGTQDMGDELGRKLALSQIDALDGAVAAFRKTQLSRWPLHSLTEELLELNTKDEPAYLLSFVAGAPAAQASGTQP
ncbi:hypothetical protein JY651_40585 [Pyxidicoccus parkwayensis]|uniref:Tetratricopeptide repeat protein n=1 Tax=Pyxidicoccus parkwayensis TaxID=2813578 RepID=A0ABX7NRU4_9BACT|nr:hypothetical protein [Pyxidicoccus parkwaysis]QSQ21423.1 hypothetical protein JY651_40585 [Pyxidicoccus parkwaysis]